MNGVIIEPFPLNWKDDSEAIGGGWPSNFNVSYFCEHFKPSLIDNLTSDSYYYINKCVDICFASHGEQIEEIVGKHGLVVISRVGSNPESFIYESDVLTKYIVSLYQLCQFQ